jgi:tetratricopeptide (TPR) repeat protein
VQEHRQIAERHYVRGEQLSQAGNLDEAVEEYHAAMMMDRDNLVYQQALARVLYRRGSLAEAKSYLRPLLERDPIDGPTNLMMARTLAQERGLPARRGFSPPSLEQVEDFYRRAVYGQWPEDESSRRFAARFELIDLLRVSGRRNQAVAELAALADEIPGDRNMQVRVANLLYESGAAEQSSEIIRGLLKDSPRDADLYAALARAEFELGNYAGAGEAYRSAIRWKPDSPDLRQRLEVVNDIISLDPADPRLRQAERMSRARRLLRRAVAVAGECLKSKPPKTAPLTELLAKAEDFTNSGASAGDEAVETGFGFAEQIWTEARNACGSIEKRDEALAKVLSRVDTQ